jgi:hypothetical protein
MLGAEPLLAAGDRALEEPVGLWQAPTISDGTARLSSELAISECPGAEQFLIDWGARAAQVEWLAGTARLPRAAKLARSDAALGRGQVREREQEDRSDAPRVQPTPAPASHRALPFNQYMARTLAEFGLDALMKKFRVLIPGAHNQLWLAFLAIRRPVLIGPFAPVVFRGAGRDL